MLNAAISRPGDSEFNRQDLEALGFTRTGVLPVVPDFSHLDGAADRTVADQFDDAWTNVLFVGRTVPNKKLEDVIRFFHWYHTFYNPHSRLFLIGAQHGLDRYTVALHQLAATLGNDHVHVVGQVSNDELAAFYEIADLFLCASEHEGFCVPLVEAFYKQIPVLAYAAAAYRRRWMVPGCCMPTGSLARRRTDGHHHLERRRAGPSSAVNAAIDWPCARGLRRHAPGPRRQDPLSPLIGRTAPDLRLLGPVRCCRSARGNASRSPVHLRRPAPTMIVNQWLAAAHKGDAIGDSARRTRRLLRSLGHEAELFALTINEDLEDEVRPFTDPAARHGDVTVLHYALPSPMTAALASPDRGRVLHYHNVTPPAYFAPCDAGLVRLAILARQELKTPVGHVDLALGVSGVQPPGTGVARLLANRRPADCGRHGPPDGGRPPPGHRTAAG
jgi:hypothetical protein